MSLGSLQLTHRLIQGPLAGFSCAPFRELFAHFVRPAYCVTEMLSAHDVVYKHSLAGRYLYRSPDEGLLCYQISGNDPTLMADAAAKLAEFGADLIDINCGCPKNKIRKNGAGSALLEQPQQLLAIVRAVRSAIKSPLTVKIRIQGNSNDIELAKQIVDAGVDGLIVHGRRWVDDYDTPSDLQQIAKIKQVVAIPLIANGDIADSPTLIKALTETGCDGFMISRASTGKPWLFQELLSGLSIRIEKTQLITLFMIHLGGLASLENEYKAVLQSKSLVRYYFKGQLSSLFLQDFYQLSNLQAIYKLLQERFKT